MTFVRDSTIVVHAAGRVHALQRGPRKRYPAALYRAIGARSAQAIQSYLDSLSITAFYDHNGDPAGPNPDGIEWVYVEEALTFAYVLPEATYTVTLKGPAVAIEGSDGSSAAGLWRGAQIAGKGNGIPGAERSLGRGLIEAIENGLAARVSRYPDNEAIKGRRIATAAAQGARGGCAATVIGRCPDGGYYRVQRDNGERCWVAHTQMSAAPSPVAVSPNGGSFAW